MTSGREVVPTHRQPGRAVGQDLVRSVRIRGGLRRRWLHGRVRARSVAGEDLEVAEAQGFGE